jgi:uncharacterized membrane protein
MTKGRMEAFSDGVIAILITIMVLELRPPEGADLAALRPVVPRLVTYVLSFVNLGIYWNNHHHMLHAAEHVNGRVLWANMHLLFWLSLLPFATAWMGENHFHATPVALYGAVLLAAALAYTLLQRSIIAVDGHNARLGAAVGRDLKGKLSALAYAAGIGLAFVDRRIALALYVTVTIAWLVPDPRIESRLVQEEHARAQAEAARRRRSR